MRKCLPLCYVMLMVLGCKTGKKTPDTSNIPVTVKIERFDEDFF